MTINATATHQQSAPPPILLNDRLRGHALWDCKEMEESAGAPPRFTVKYMAAGSVHHVKMVMGVRLYTS